MSRFSLASAAVRVSKPCVRVAMKPWSSFLWSSHRETPPTTRATRASREVKAPARPKPTRGPGRSGSVDMGAPSHPGGPATLGVTWRRAVRLAPGGREGVGAVRGHVGPDLEHDHRVAAQRDRRRVPRPRSPSDVAAHAAGEARDAVAPQRLAPRREQVAERAALAG